MIHMIRENGKVVLMIFLSVCILTILFGVFFPLWKSAEVNQSRSVADGNYYTMINACPSLTVPLYIRAKKGETVDLMHGVLAEDSRDGTLSSRVKIRFAGSNTEWSVTDGKSIYTPDFTGRRYLEFSVRNSMGFLARKKVLFLVNKYDF